MRMGSGGKMKNRTRDYKQWLEETSIGSAVEMFQLYSIVRDAENTLSAERYRCTRTPSNELMISAEGLSSSLVLSSFMREEFLVYMDSFYALGVDFQAEIEKTLMAVL